MKTSYSFSFSAKFFEMITCTHHFNSDLSLLPLHAQSLSHVWPGDPMADGPHLLYFTKTALPELANDIPNSKSSVYSSVNFLSWSLCSIWLLPS